MKQFELPLSDFSYFSLAVAFTLVSASSSVYCSPKSDEPSKTITTLNLKSGLIQFSKASSNNCLSKLQTSSVDHIFCLGVLRQIPNASERSFLAQYAEVGEFYSPFVYAIKIKSADIKSAPLSDWITYLYLMEPKDKVLPAVWNNALDSFVAFDQNGKVYNYVLKNGSLKLIVSSYLDSDPGSVSATLKLYAASIVPRSRNRWEILITHDKLLKLAAENEIKWIDVVQMPPAFQLDHSRQVLNVDTVQQFDIASGVANGVSGEGVHVGIFDKGIAPHQDLPTPTFPSSIAAGESAHGTHVAAIVAGRGIASITVPGASGYQWRGIAPSSQLIDIASVDGVAAMDANILNESIRTLYMDVSNHSYSYSTNGAYVDSDSFRDQTIRGDVQTPGSTSSAVLPRLQIYSAGNYGQNSGPYTRSGYFSVTSQSKNALVVGASNGNATGLVSMSSLGPTGDGRIKPDVVAPGACVKSAVFCNAASSFPSDSFSNCSPSTDTCSLAVRPPYRPLTGTSMAAPAIAGSVALLLQQYSIAYNIDLSIAPPLPSTLRALIVNSAQDLIGSFGFGNRYTSDVQGYPGPDFASGYGIPRVSDGIDLVKNRSIREDELVATCDKKEYLFSIPSGYSGPLKITLAWDDPDFTPEVEPSGTLRNDLDLLLIGPNGVSYYPWQLDQEMLDSHGNVLGDDEQPCDTQLSVHRTFSSIPPAMPNAIVPQARKGPDHLNNLEQVEITTPQAGIWIARVTMFRHGEIVTGAQQFSLVGAIFNRRISINSVRLCSYLPFLCGALKYEKTCERNPAICDVDVFPLSDPEELRFNFSSMQKRLVIPAAELMDSLTRKMDCKINNCSTKKMRIKGLSDDVGLQIYNRDGKLFYKNEDSDIEINLPSEKELEGLFLTIAPQSAKALGAVHSLRFELK